VHKKEFLEVFFPCSYILNMKGDFMISRDVLKRDIDILPDEALDDVYKYLLMQKFYFDH